MVTCLQFVAFQQTKQTNHPSSSTLNLSPTSSPNLVYMLLLPYHPPSWILSPGLPPPTPSPTSLPPKQHRPPCPPPGTHFSVCPPVQPSPACPSPWPDPWPYVPCWPLTLANSLLHPTKPDFPGPQCPFPPPGPPKPPHSPTWPPPSPPIPLRAPARPSPWPSVPGPVSVTA